MAGLPAGARRPARPSDLNPRRGLPAHHRRSACSRGPRRPAPPAHAGHCASLGLDDPQRDALPPRRCARRGRRDARHPGTSPDRRGEAAGQVVRARHAVAMAQGRQDAPGGRPPDRRHPTRRVRGRPRAGDRLARGTRPRRPRPPRTAARDVRREATARLAPVGTSTITCGSSGCRGTGRAGLTLFRSAACASIRPAAP